MDQIDVWKLLLFDSNTWYHITVCKWFVSKVTWTMIVYLELLATWNHITVGKQMIIFK